MKDRNGQNGITIISLVVTIIVLMILAGISIYGFTKHSEINDKVKEKAKIEDYKTQMENILLDLQAESSLGLSNENLMEKFAEEVKKIEGISEEDIKVEEEKVKVKTQEGYEFEVTIYGVEYIGKNGELLDSDDTDPKEITPQQGEVKIIYDKVNWNASKEITLDANDQEIEYAIGEESWTQYVKDEKIKIDKNNIMLYARVKGNTDKDKETREIITNIDTKSPIELNLEEIKNEGEEFEIKVTAKDDAKNNESGISGISKFEFLYSADGEEFLVPKDGGSRKIIPKETAEITYNFLGLNEKVKYTIKVIAYDQAGNKIENTMIANKNGLEITPTEVQSNLTKYLGKYVNYKIDLDGTSKPDWRIFYAQEVDEKPRIYLIASDYVPTGNELITTVKGKLGFEKSASSGYEPLNIYWSSEKTDLEKITAPSNYKTLFKEGNYTWNGNYQNSKYASAMLQPSYWDSFIPEEMKTKEENVAEVDKTYVIGGPTVQMWCAAWNTLMPASGKNSDEFTKITADTSNEYGYYYSSSTQTNQTDMYINGSTSPLASEKLTLLQTDNIYNLFFPHTSYLDLTANGTKGNCVGYCLSSPSAINDSGLVRVSYDGRLHSSNYNDNVGYGLRPVICLASDTLLIDGAKQESGIPVYDLK